MSDRDRATAGPVPPEAKILDRESLAREMAERGGRRVVFTNGCFDILHPGHVRYLFEARALGDILVVGLNTDASVKRLKGAGRPVNAEDSRAIVLAGMGCVDRVTLFDEDTPLELVRAIRPDVLVKGGDYRADDVVGAREVRDSGGSVVILPFHQGHSTTSVIERMRRIDG